MWKRETEWSRGEGIIACDDEVCREAHSRERVSRVREHDESEARQRRRKQSRV